VSNPLDPFPPNTVSPFLTSAATGNAVLDEARRSRDRRDGPPAGGVFDVAFEASTKAWVQWTGSSVSTLDAFSVLAYGSAVVDPSADATSRLASARRPAFEGNTPAGCGLFVVTLQPIQGQQIGQAVTSGLVPVQVNVTSTAHTRAVPVATTTGHLDSSATDGVPVVWPRPFTATGVQWAVVLLGDLTCGGTTGSTTTTTTTTLPPCTGHCTFTKSGGTWSYSSDDCSPLCGCFYPPACPPECGASTAKTPCMNNGGGRPKGSPPNCSGTTTTRPPCSGLCNWVDVVPGVWQVASQTCSQGCGCIDQPVPAATGCGAALGIGCGFCPNSYDGENFICEGGTTTAPPGGCGGGGKCTWQCGYTTETLDSPGQQDWVFVVGDCENMDAFPGMDCGCPKPEPNGPGNCTCGDVAYTNCLGGGPGTTPPPGVCSGQCFYVWNGSSWDFCSTNCVGCTCSQPLTSGSTAGETATTACWNPTTTTTSSSTTSTTTTEPPIYYCVVVDSSDGGPCPPVGSRFCSTFTGSVGCGGGLNYHASIVSGPYTLSACTAACPTGTTSTTTSTTTTTSTSTTTSGPWMLWTGPSCGAVGTCGTSNPCSGTASSGPYASCTACKSANPSALGPC
jgi:hypothetical protein